MCGSIHAGRAHSANGWQCGPLRHAEWRDSVANQHHTSITSITHLRPIEHPHFILPHQYVLRIKHTAGCR